MDGVQDVEVVEEGHEELVETGVADVRLELHASRAQDPDALVCGVPRHLVEHRGLAHPRLAREQQGRTLDLGVGQEGPDEREVLVPSDQIRADPAVPVRPRFHAAMQSPSCEGRPDSTSAVRSAGGGIDVNNRAGPARLSDVKDVVSE